jgi:hypothetical protein
VLALFTVILAPVALLALGLWVFGLFAGAVPALAALGRRVTRNRYGLMGSFVAAAIGWRLLRIIPLAGFFIFGLVVIWGMGAWAISLWEGWRASAEVAEVLPGGDSAREVLTEPGPRMELLGLEVPTSEGSGESDERRQPPAPSPQPPAREGPSASRLRPPANPGSTSGIVDPPADPADT